MSLISKETNLHFEEESLMIENPGFKNSELNRFKLNNKIAIITSKGYTFVEVDTVVRCEADGKDTLWFLNNNQQLRSSQILKKVEEKLKEHNFHRIHHSHLVNINYIDQYTKTKGSGGMLVLSNGENIEISKRKKTSFLRKLK